MSAFLKAAAAAAAPAAKADDPKCMPDLPLPPKTIRMVLFDMDQTLLSTHTGGCFRGKLEELALKVVPAFVHVVPKLVANGFLVGIVTFSDALMKAPGTSGWAGESLVTELLLLAFASHFAQTIPAATKAQAQKMAADMVGAMPIAAAFPPLRNMQPQLAAAAAHLPRPAAMPNNKSWHIDQVKAAVWARAGEQLQNDQLMLFDDSEPNVKDAAVTRVHAFGVDRKVGFTSRDWIDGVQIVCARAANPALPITGVMSAAGALKAIKTAPLQAFGAGSGPAGPVTAAAAGVAAGGLSLSVATAPTPKSRGPPTPHPPNANLSIHQPPVLLISPRFSVTDGANSSTSTIHSLPPTPHSGSSAPYVQHSGPASAAAGMSSGGAAAAAAALASPPPGLSHVPEYGDQRSALAMAALQQAAQAALANASAYQNAAIANAAAAGVVIVPPTPMACGVPAGLQSPTDMSMGLGAGMATDAYAALIGSGTLVPPGAFDMTGGTGAAGGGGVGGSAGYYGGAARPPPMMTKSSSSAAAVGTPSTGTSPQLSPRAEYDTLAQRSGSGGGGIGPSGGGGGSFLGAPVTGAGYGAGATAAGGAGGYGYGYSAGVRALRPSSASLSSGGPAVRPASAAAAAGPGAASPQAMSISPPPTGGGTGSSAAAAANAAWASAGATIGGAGPSGGMYVAAPNSNSSMTGSGHGSGPNSVAQSPTHALSPGGAGGSGFGAAAAAAASAPVTPHPAGASQLDKLSAALYASQQQQAHAQAQAQAQRTPTSF